MSVKDLTQESKILKETMGTVGEICILVKYSPKREILLGEIQSNIKEITEGEEEFVKRTVTTLDKLCPTRWTVRAKCYQKIIDNYESLMELWQTSLKNGKLVFDVKSRITECLAQMCKFRFYYGLDIAYKFYSLTDSLSKALQNKKMSAISGQRLARLTISTIEGMRTDRHADNFFE